MDLSIIGECESEIFFKIKFNFNYFVRVVFLLLCGFSSMTHQISAANHNTTPIKCLRGFTLISKMCIRVHQPAAYQNCRLINHNAIINYLKYSKGLKKFLRLHNVSEFWLDKRIVRMKLENQMSEELEREWMDNVTSLIYNTDLINFRNCYKYTTETSNIILSDCKNNHYRLCTYDPSAKQLLTLACPKGSMSVIYSKYQDSCFYVDSGTAEDVQKNIQFKGKEFKPQNFIDSGIYQELITEAAKTKPARQWRAKPQQPVVRVFKLMIKQPVLRLFFNESNYKLLLHVTSPEFILRRNTESNGREHYGILCYMQYSVLLLKLDKIMASSNYSLFEIKFQSKSPRYYYCEATQIFHHKDFQSLNRQVVAYKGSTSPIFTVQLELKLNVLLFLNLLSGLQFRNSGDGDIHQINEQNADLSETLIKNIEFIRIENYDIPTNESKIFVHIEVMTNDTNYSDEAVVSAYNRLNTTLWKRSQNKSYEFKLHNIRSSRGCISENKVLVNFNESIVAEKGCVLRRERMQVSTCLGDMVYGGYLNETEEQSEITCFSEDDMKRLLKFIGQIMSISGILIIILTAAIFREWRSKMPNQLILHLSLTLGIFIILVMITDTLELEWDRNIDLLFNVIIPMFRMSTFIWSLMIAFRLYILYVRVFHTYLLENFFQVSALISYGIPAIPTVIRTLVLILICRENMYSDCDADTNALMYGFTYPIIIALLINLIIFGLILFNIWSKSKVRKSKRGVFKKIEWNKIRVSVVSFILLSLVWIFYLINKLIVGVTKQKSMFVEFFFEILVALQGFIIFVYFVLIVTDTRKKWTSLLFNK